MTRRLLAILSISLIACFAAFGAPAALAVEEGSEQPASGAELQGSEGAPTDDKSIKLVNPLGTKSVPQAIGRIIDTMLGLLGSGAFLMFVWGGFTWLISGGNSDKIKQGKKTIVWATLGLILVFASAGLVRFVLWLVRAGS